MPEKDILNLDSIKGAFLGTCYRGVCNNTGSTWFNHSTKQYYCVSCAASINEHNRADAMRMYKHDLCTAASPGNLEQAARDLRDYFEYNLAGSHNAAFTAFILAARWCQRFSGKKQYEPFQPDSNQFLQIFNKILNNSAKPEEIEFAMQYAAGVRENAWADKLYAMLKQLFDRYSDHFLSVDEQAAGDLLTDYQTRNIP